MPGAMQPAQRQSRLGGIRLGKTANWMPQTAESQAAAFWTMAIASACFVTG
jgi:hypothetical protein